MKTRDKIYLIRKKLTRTFKEVFQILFLKSNENNSTERYIEGNETLFGHTITYPDYLSYINCYREIFEDHIYSIGKIENPYIIDCGSNIGLSVIYFKTENPSAKILAFEADPSVYKFLNENIKSFNLDKVELVNKALWDTKTTILFNSEGADSGRIWDLKEDALQLQKQEIETVILSEYITEKIDLLKLDIEGAETKVLFEIENKLHLINRIFIEYHSFANSTQSLDEILSILRRNGYRYYINNAVNASKKPFHNIVLNFEMDNQLNIFAYR